ncbi:MAG TPA: tRNA pseudouridine(55) synthase TruB, partial [Fimbriimonadales bacterium]|nr:tRNA pseudouridine(55) synthase TruB [Fimbriimonadales bacterium]
MLGILLVDKPVGISSHDAVYRVRKRLGIRRVGHLGTLDPLATGLLVMGIGYATRFLEYVPAEPKEYIGEIRLGISTSTQDAEGEVLAEKPGEGIVLADIQRAARSFLGETEQVPPMHSAVTVGGRRLYDLARKGIEIERPARKIHVFAFDIWSVADGLARFRIVCSGGTYVRTVASDLGDLLGVGAHLASLRRSKVGEFKVEAAKASERVSGNDLIPLRDALADLPSLLLQPEEAARLR